MRMISFAAAPASLLITSDCPPLLRVRASALQLPSSLLVASVYQLGTGSVSVSRCYRCFDRHPAAMSSSAKVRRHRRLRPLRLLRWVLFQKIRLGHGRRLQARRGSLGQFQQLLDQHSLRITRAKGSFLVKTSRFSISFRDGWHNVKYNHSATSSLSDNLDAT
ncbi:hypothetical protein BC834DRAFT_393689 [Gloeopeniophorella convolvens]|nr:hypothetical protein BC834DRAFT_393689 [Gloeopeniophorella convolvens]